MKNWIQLEQPVVNEVNSLQTVLKIPHFICSLLLQRGVNSLDKAKLFFRPELSSLHDPYLMKDMEKAYNEFEEANEENAKVVLDNNEPINIKTLISLVSNAKFIIANDTGPAHIASHLDKNGVVLFGSHTTAKKVSMVSFNFKAILSLIHI